MALLITSTNHAETIKYKRTTARRPAKKKGQIGCCVDGQKSRTATYFSDTFRHLSLAAKLITIFVRFCSAFTAPSAFFNS